ncbi:Wound-induced protein [Carex littledalei]|uniref:Wound-induced protein n=1 Tax=Carex littledalei TaxID=544730 RepID=A0A833QJ03_9POAL|nr:Wound-induced protein [Carex littledalei]
MRLAIQFKDQALKTIKDAVPGGSGTKRIRNLSGERANQRGEITTGEIENKQIKSEEEALRTVMYLSLWGVGT